MRWFAVLDASGAPVSVGTVLADPLPKGLTAIEVDGPAEGRPWDADARSWGPKPEPPVVEQVKEIDREKAAQARAAATAARSLDDLRAAFVALVDAVAPQEVAPGGQVGESQAAIR